MKKAVYAVGLTLAALTLSAVSFAQAGQVAPPATAIFSVTNNDLSSGNSATVVKCTPGSTYHCSVFNTLQTGGEGLGGGYFAAPRVGQENTSACLYIADAASSDIAAFWKNGSTFSKTGNYSNSA